MSLKNLIKKKTLIVYKTNCSTEKEKGHRNKQYYPRHLLHGPWGWQFFYFYFSAHLNISFNSNKPGLASELG
jgi:hypothetical protein